MGLFGKKKVEPPAVRREDFAAAIAGAPDGELTYLRHAEDELHFLEGYFNRNLPDESVLAVASSGYLGTGVSFGIIVVTKDRILAAVGEKYKNGHLVGEPSLYDFPMAHVSVETQPYGHGYAASFQLTRQSPVTLLVGHEMAWAQKWFDTVNRQITATL